MSCEWSEYDVIFLCDNWGKMRASEIGRKLGGKTKSSIVGKAHRLKLPKLIASPSTRRAAQTLEERVRAQRESDRKRRERQRQKLGLPPPPAKPKAQTLAPLLSLIAEAKEQDKQEVSVVVLPPAPKPPPVRASAKVVLGVLKQCCWPIGDPKAPDFHFCCERALFGKPYCDEHTELAYASRRKLDEAA